MPKICVAITASNVEDARKDARRAMKLGANLVEHRIDFIKNPNSNKVSDLFNGKNYPAIITNRRKEEGGKFKGDDIERTNLLIDSLNSQEFRPDFVDIELETAEHNRNFLIAATKFSGIKSIISKHIMNFTPDLDQLVAVYDISRTLGADIVKIVTFANSKSDNEIIYRLIEKTKGGPPLIALAMGEFGKETRIESVKRGAFLTFASLESGKESAPGQIPIHEMKKAFEQIES